MSNHATSYLLLVILLLFIIYSLFFTKQAIKSAQALDFQKASQVANKVILLPNLLSKITFHKIPDLEIWRLSLELIKLSPRLEQTKQEYFASIFEQEQSNNKNIEQLNEQLSQLNYLLTQLLNYSNHSLLVKNKKFQDAKFKIENLSTVIKLAQEQLRGQYRYMLVFQNSQELRATGGFMGSFALLNFNNGIIEELNFYDIYDADGQFKTQVEAPAGIKEYLSEGKGQRLPDANWHPDFPSSSQKILKFMEIAEFKNIDGVVAINLEIVEDLLDLLGGVYLPDYGMTITSDNFADIARADRESFFPGKKAKKQFLETLFNHLKIKLNQLNPDQQRKLLQKVNYQLQIKNLQFFSTNSDIQSNFEKLNIAGELSSINYPLLYLVESNVGINKANREVTREVRIDIDNKNINLEVLFTNHNQDLDYINYQRLITNSENKIQNIKINKQDLETWDEEIITNSKGEKFKQIGFLAPVAVGQATIVQIQLLSTSSPLLTILKQSGLPATNYTVTNMLTAKTQSFSLEKDSLIEL